MKAKEIEIVERYQFWRTIIEEENQKENDDSPECGACGCGGGCQGSCCE